MAAFGMASAVLRRLVTSSNPMSTIRICAGCKITVSYSMSPIILRQISTTTPVRHKRQWKEYDINPLDPTKRDAYTPMPKQTDLCIYRGSSAGYLFLLKSVSVISSAVTATLMATAFKDSVISFSLSSPLSIFLVLVSSIFTLTPFAIHYFTRRYVVELYYSKEKDEFNAYCFGFFPFFNSKIHTFTWDNIYAPDVPGPFTTFLIEKPNGKRIPLLMFEDDLTNPEAVTLYKKMLGLDDKLDAEIEKIRKMKSPKPPKRPPTPWDRNPMNE